MNAPLAPAGLEGVVVAETRISYADLGRGRLIVRGRDVAALADSATYEEVVALAWDGIVPGTVTREALGAARVRAYGQLVPFLPLLAGRDAFDVMRVLTAALPDGPRETGAAGMLGALAVAAALGIRAEAGAAPIPPDPALGHAADILRMIGAATDERRARALDTYLVTVVDHSVNASTFAARITASTRAGLNASVSAALAAFKGPLHGGAPRFVLDFLDEIARAPDAARDIEARIGRGDRLFGFGSRGYPGRDPRTDLFKARLLGLDGRTARIAFAEEVEAAVLDAFVRLKAGRVVQTNIEYYAALLLEAVGLPRTGFTPVFAAGRAAGWIGHVHEQQAGGRLIRPSARYVGEAPAD